MQPQEDDWAMARPSVGWDDETQPSQSESAPQSLEDERSQQRNAANSAHTVPSAS
jgi:hypothetical protein